MDKDRLVNKIVIEVRDEKLTEELIRKYAKVAGEEVARGALKDSIAEKEVVQKVMLNQFIERSLLSYKDVVDGTSFRIPELEEKLEAFDEREEGIASFIINYAVYTLEKIISLEEKRTRGEIK